ncbi:AAA family ATPase [Aggregatibacter actinomycetemcomitans]|uniref:AAA family ATPase n=1 Tax=Aggregatibacter actinomycetemcomitans TaxID=714 RepID=UPI001E3BE222|nr:AAA family ATPase [Aggregatibacter actinomycetemcomitans]
MILRQQISALIKSGKLTQARLARETGVNNGALSAWLNDKYTGNAETVETPIENWLALGNRKVQVFVEPPNFIDTPTAKKVFAALDMAKFTGAIVPIYGASGVGKTKAAEEYSKCNPNVWMITISPSRAGLTAFLYELALELGIKDAPRTKARLSRAVKDKLIGTEGLVIVDESDHLTYDSIEELRYLQEKAESTRRGDYVRHDFNRTKTNDRGQRMKSLKMALMLTALLSGTAVAQTPKCPDNDEVCCRFNIAKSRFIDSTNTFFDRYQEVLEQNDEKNCWSFYAHDLFLVL